jgi:hypothetical protein
MTRFAKEVRQDVVVGRVSVSRRTAMNVIIGTAAMSISATPVSAGELPRTAQLEQLIRVRATIDCDHPLRRIATTRYD